MWDVAQPQVEHLKALLAAWQDEVGQSKAELSRRADVSEVTLWRCESQGRAPSRPVWARLRNALRQELNQIRPPAAPRAAPKAGRECAA